MKWSNLHPWQRDQLIAEKVMGETNFFCIGELVFDGSNTLYHHNFYLCQECGARLTATSDYLMTSNIPIEHNKHIPAYSTSLNAAWSIINKMVSSKQETFGRFCGDLLDMGWASVESEGIYPASETIRIMAKLTPEKICLAALKACGVEVEV